MSDQSVYINVLIDTLESKNKILDNIVILTKKQDELADVSKLDMDAFNTLLEEKDKLIEQLNALDEGFDLLYQRVKDEIQIKKAVYQSEIKTMQGLITVITDKSVKIQVAEARNKEKMKLHFSKIKKEIKSFKSNNQVANSYGKNMANRSTNESFFLDKKK